MAPTNWVVIAVAVGVALFAIGTAALTASYEPTAGTSTSLSAMQGNDTEDAGADWRTAVETIATFPRGEGGEYIAPKELGPTEAMSEELLAAYLSTVTTGELSKEEQEEIVNRILERNIAPVVASRSYTEASLVTVPDGDLVEYAGRLTETLAKSTKVEQHELTLFGRAVGQESAHGTSELQAAAAVYREIENELARMRVPGVIAKEHLEVLRSVTQMSHVVYLMGTWNGEPTLGLSYINAFLEAERDVQVTLYDIYRRMSTLVQQS